ncbi:MAG: ATP-binding protein [Clostridia bacterium]|nr:ATP-binding protein [Clostridia bacterium]
MMRALQRRFIRIALIVFSVAVLFVTVVLNVANLFFVRIDIEAEALNLSQRLPVPQPRTKQNGEWSRTRRKGSFENKYFTVLVAPDKRTADVSHISGYSEEEAFELADRILATGKESGYIEDCYYLITPKNDTLREILFLDCAMKLDAVRFFREISAFVALFAIIVSGLLVWVFSKRAIRPFIENDEKQKRFITDASHELKTPLAVISANMELLSMENGENEWIRGTQKQVGQMRRLVNDLVFLARSNETPQPELLTDCDLSGLVTETAEPFVFAAEAKGQSVSVDVSPDIRLKADMKELTRVVSVLCDNALKYAPEGDRIDIRLFRSRRCAVLETENSVTEPIPAETLSHLFDRFSRADESRTRDGEQGGFGIGLAIVRAVAEKLGGSVTARMENERLVISVRVKTEQ